MSTPISLNQPNLFGLHLPPTLICSIFNFLWIQDIAKGNEICKNWYSGLHSSTAKKMLYPLYLPIPTPSSIRTKAEQGDPLAQAQMCEYYQLNWAKDDEKCKLDALKWAKLSAAQGHADGQASLGIFYYFGEGIEKNEEEGMRLFRLGMTGNSQGKGQGVGTLIMSLCYELGYGGVSKDLKQSISYLTLSAEQGCARAQLRLGTALWSGIYGQQDRTEAIRLLRLSALQGVTPAMHSLSAFLSSEDFDIQEIEKNKVEIIRWARLAANVSDPEAQCTLGYCYDTGFGVPIDERQSTYWYTLAAEQGDVDAQYSLGVHYRTIDTDKAIYWYEKAAKQGDEEASKAVKVLQNGLGSKQIDLKGVIELMTSV